MMICKSKWNNILIQVIMLMLVMISLIACGSTRENDKSTKITSSEESMVSTEKTESEESEEFLDLIESTLDGIAPLLDLQTQQSEDFNKYTSLTNKSIELIHAGLIHYLRTEKEKSIHGIYFLFKDDKDTRDEFLERNIALYNSLLEEAERYCLALKTKYSSSIEDAVISREELDSINSEINLIKQMILLIKSSKEEAENKILD